MNKDKLNEIAFGIIANAGEAKTIFLEAIDLANQGMILKAKDKIKEGREWMVKAHKPHFEVITGEAQGKDVALTLLFMHAEDQFMSAETTCNLAEKFIALNEKLMKGK